MALGEAGWEAVASAAGRRGRWQKWNERGKTKEGKEEEGEGEENLGASLASGLLGTADSLRGYFKV